MKKIKYFIVIIIIVIIYFNNNYPFFTYGSLGWSVGYQFVKEDSLFNLSIKNGSIISSSKINTFNKNNESIFIADPFYIKHNDKIYLFIENQVKNDNARIDVLISKNGIDFEYGGLALDENFHISYPQVFKDEEGFYMIPETKNSNNVLLYYTNNFPYDWKIKDTLIKNVRYKDPTLVSLKNKKYLFTVDDELNLYIFKSKKIQGPWELCKNYREKKGNEARLAGRYFKYKDKIYLPFQNLSKGYGTGVSLYSVSLKDNEIKLKKEKHLYLKPEIELDFFNKGMHHLDVQKVFGGYFITYDGQRRDNRIHFNWKRTIKHNLIDLGLY
ncbi:hypothetical protein OD91_0108 [Lutibacter sp. Hel_I_33_5]|uniref:glucosamine inositolphosphorylceramide transferase family protein n=1 Tax=Lutibacter sp. Hel_I_33_5 TaxID=1566289 RepID=UPI0011A39F95|nr:hypothetical protein [Lutibacter sp. Hel_I_33_5]TVZ54871.1 hypothetical protein OD91_0108 [Lutibacter sp. Hel_I_33_5]